jgi:hypothetical protein
MGCQGTQVAMLGGQQEQAWQVRQAAGQVLCSPLSCCLLSWAVHAATTPCCRSCISHVGVLALSCTSPSRRVLVLVTIFLFLICLVQLPSQR